MKIESYLNAYDIIICLPQWLMRHNADSNDKPALTSSRNLHQIKTHSNMKNVTWLEFGPDISVSWNKPRIQIYKTCRFSLESIITLKHNTAVLLTSTSAPITKLARTPADALMDFSDRRRAREPIKANINLTFTFGMNHSHSELLMML